MPLTSFFMVKVNQSLVDAGKTASLIHQTVAKMVAPGVNLLVIEEKIKKMISSAQMRPAFFGYRGYPAASCLSVNSAVVHAIPRDYLLQAGDILSVDLGVENNGWIVDTAWTHAVGDISAETAKLLEVTRNALSEGIKMAKIGNNIGDIGEAIQKTVEAAGFHIIKELTGHGVGKKLQLPPNVPNYGRSGQGPLIKEGMILALEPITALRPVKIVVESDNWTIRAVPDVICAHFEHTIFISKNGPVTLT